MNPDERDNEPLEKLDPLSELDLQIARLEGRLKRTKNIYPLTGIITALLLVVGAALELGLPNHYREPNRSNFGWIFVVYGIVTPIVFVGMKVFADARTQSELDLVTARRRVLSRFASPATVESLDHKDPNYFDSLVKINVENLAAYYALVKVQTDKSFTVSVSAGLIGFILILIGLIFGFTGGTNSPSLAYVSAGAGVITEFISGVFFYLYNQTVRQMKGYHDSLLSVQNVLLSLKLVDDTKASDSEKVKMVTQMLSYLIGGDSKRAQPEAKGASVISDEESASEKKDDTVTKS